VFGIHSRGGLAPYHPRGKYCFPKGVFGETRCQRLEDGQKVMVSVLPERQRVSEGAIDRGNLHRDDVWLCNRAHLFFVFFLLWANQKIRSFELGRARCKYLQGRIESKKNSLKKKKQTLIVIENSAATSTASKEKIEQKKKPPQNKPKQTKTRRNTSSH
jgi:hypothetical protein